VDHVNFISNTKVLGFVFQNSQARHARQRKHVKEERMQKFLDLIEKGGFSVDLSIPYQGESFTIKRAEAKNGDKKGLAVGELRNRI
jgi:hypothetical protein